MKTKTIKLVLNGFGEYLGCEKGRFFIRNSKTKSIRHIALSENLISEIEIKSGNSVSVGALVSCYFWGIPVTFFTGYGRPVAWLQTLSDYSHVQTRISQYEALNNGKGLHIAKQIVLSKLEGQNQVLQKYGLRSHDTFRIQQQIKRLEGDLNGIRVRLMNVEGHFSERYFQQLFILFREYIRPERRKTFGAYDGTNNLFNLAYEILSWHIQKALINAKLEPHLGFLHSVNIGRESLIWDFIEPYRYLMDDCTLRFGQTLRKTDFKVKIEEYPDRRKTRMFLSEEKKRAFMDNLEREFERIVLIPRIRRGKKQTVETLINEEALLFASYLRNEKEDWKPRIVPNDSCLSSPKPLIAGKP
jgi:CRISPR-associated protein Cas1